VDVLEFDPFGPPFLDDPYPQFAEHVRRHPVFYAQDLGYWVVSRYDDCRRVLRDYAAFSASNALAPVTTPCPAARQTLSDGGFRSIPTITNVDPPAHTRTRRIAQAAFTPRRVTAMADIVRRLVRDYLDRHRIAGRSDIVADLTWELPALVLFNVLGVPASDVSEVKEGAKTRLRFMFGRADDDEQIDIAHGMARFWRYCEDLADDRRANPRDDFTSDLVHTPDESGQPLNQQEVATILFGLLLAGHETTTNLLGNGLRRFLEHRERWETLCREPALVGNAVEEVLRYDSSVIHWRRRAVADVELSGTTIPAGADVLVAIGAANRDPAVFDQPDVFDLRRRNARDHLSFGFGPHVCLGAPLARLEANVVFEELIARQPHLRLAEDQHFEFMPIIGFRGPTSLWVEA
jgi:cytochrome P450